MIVCSKRWVLAIPSVDRVCGEKAWSGVPMLVLALAILLQLSLQHHLSAIAALLLGAVDSGPLRTICYFGSSVSHPVAGVLERASHGLCGRGAGSHVPGHFESGSTS